MWINPDFEFDKFDIAGDAEFDEWGRMKPTEKPGGRQPACEGCTSLIGRVANGYVSKPGEALRVSMRL